jgi:uracil-DNA glycosylase family 4
MTTTQAFIEIIDELSQTLRFLSAKGCPGFDCSAHSLRTFDSWRKQPGPRTETLETIRADLGDCRRCRLAAGRTHIVFGEGDPHAKLVFVGEGPGYEEDQQGRPFVGAAGQLLTKIIQAIGLSREQVYICNIVKSRPPGNRTPLPDEIEACAPFVERQIAAIKPDFICALGAVAAQRILRTTQPISRLRGRLHDYHGMKVLPTYHPAYLLRNPDKKRDVWEDMKLLIEEYRYER